MVGRLAVLVVLLGTSIGFTEEIQPSRMEQRGRALAETMCSECHMRSANVVGVLISALLPSAHSIADLI